MPQMDGVDNNGHGTHVMGSLLGSPFDVSNTNNLDYRSAVPPLSCCNATSQAMPPLFFSQPLLLPSHPYRREHSTAPRHHSACSVGLLGSTNFSSFFFFA